MPSRMARTIRVCLVSLMVAACGGGGGGGGSNDGGTSATPPPLALGESRAGLSYAVHVPSVVDPTQTTAFQVFEPAVRTGGETYPLVLHSHSLGASRAKSADTLITALLTAGYGVISIDERGHGESGGDIQLMDPDVEGHDLVGILDWAEAHLDWLAYAPNGPAGAPNLVAGAVGSSYGGAFQMLLQAIDPKKRLDAIVPQVTWNDLERSLIPSDRPKASGLTLLSAIGHTTHGGFALDDPLVVSFLAGLPTLTEAPDLRDFLRYHGERYFCDGTPLASDGRGRAPLTPPVHPAAVHAMFFQGMRDPLFDFNEAFANYQCLRASGGDVRLLTHETGHNAVSGAPADPGEAFQPPGNANWDRCGNVDPIAATLAFFDEHLLGHAGASAGVPTDVCISLSAGDAVLVPNVTVGAGGTGFAVPATQIVPATAPAPVVIPLGYTTAVGGAVLAGIPSVSVDLTALLGGSDPSVALFVGIGQERATDPGYWDLVDNQVVPLVGTGHHDLPLSGIGERLAAGDRLALLLYAQAPQFALPASIQVPSPSTLAFTVSGSVFLPLLAPTP